MLLDNHIREDQTILRDPAEWAHKWAGLVRTSFLSLLTSLPSAPSTGSCAGE